MTMSQRKYTTILLKKFGVKGWKPIANVLDVNSRLAKLSEKEYMAEAQSMSMGAN